MGAYLTIERIRRLGVRLSASNGRIQIDAPAGVLNPAMRAALMECRKEAGLVLQAEAEYDRLHQEVCTLGDRAEEAETRGDAEVGARLRSEQTALAAGAYWDAGAAFREAVGVDWDDCLAMDH